MYVPVLAYDVPLGVPLRVPLGVRLLDAPYPVVPDLVIHLLVALYPVHVLVVHYPDALDLFAPILVVLHP